MSLYCHCNQKKIFLENTLVFFYKINVTHSLYVIYKSSSYFFGVSISILFKKNYFALHNVLVFYLLSEQYIFGTFPS